jgi:glucokinase
MNKTARTAAPTACTGRRAIAGVTALRRLIIGVGTGLGVAQSLSPTLVAATECGWRTFPVRDEDDLRLVEFLKVLKGVSRVSVEHVVGGEAVVGLYEFCRGGAALPLTKSPVASAAETKSPAGLTTATQLTKVVASGHGEASTSAASVRHCPPANAAGALTPATIYGLAENGDPIALTAITLQWKYLGREISELILNYIPAAVYLTGGVVAKAGNFLEVPLMAGLVESLGCEVLDEIVRRVDVFVVEREDLAMMGLLEIFCRTR